MRISTATSVFVNHTIQETVRLVAEAGYDGVDIWGGRPHVYRRDLSPTELRQLRDLLDEYNLAVPSFMPAFFRYPHSLTNPNKIIFEDSLEYMRQCCDNAVALGAQTLLIVPGRALSGQEQEDAWGRMSEAITQVYDYSSQYDTKLSIEPVNRYVSDLINTAADALRMINDTGCEGIGVTLDTGHVHLSKETYYDAIQILEDRLFHVHVNDNDGKQQQNLILGKGTFDFTGFMTQLHETGYDGFLTAELAWHYTLDPLPAAQQTAELVRKLI